MKKIKILFIVFIAMFVTLFVSCSEIPTKYVVSVTNNDGVMVIEYSDGTKDTITIPAGEKGDAGEKGEQGPQGPQGEPGKPGDPGASAEEIEFRFYKSAIWWRYVGSDTWVKVVTVNEINQEALEISEFAMSVYVEEIDVSLTISDFVTVNGNWSPYEIIGNTLTTSYQSGDETSFIDVTVENGETNIITYKEEGSQEKELMAINNLSTSEFVGVFTLKVNGTDHKFEYNKYGSANFDDNFMNGFVKGDTLYCTTFDNGQNVIVKKTSDGLVFSGKFANGDSSETFEAAPYVKWVDKQFFVGTYSIVASDDSANFDFAVTDYSLELYDGGFNSYEYNEDQISFTVDSVTYVLKYDNDGIAVSSNVDGVTYILTKHQEIKQQLKTFTVVFADGTKQYSINEYGGVNCEEQYFGDAKQKANVLTISRFDSVEKLIITLEESGKLTCVYTSPEGVESAVQIVTKVEITEFVGNYVIKYDGPYGEIVSTFIIGPNPYEEGLAIIIGDNPYNFNFDEETGIITYINYRASSGYIIKANPDGTKGVTMFSLNGETFEPDPNTFIECRVEFTK